MKPIVAAALVAISFAAAAAEPAKRELLHQMFIAMGADLPGDAPQLAAFERRLSVADIQEVIAFFKTPAGRHLAEASQEVTKSAVVNLEAAITRSKEKRTMADLRTLAVSLEAYAIDHDAYPATADLDHLSTLITPTYLRSMVRLDGWGKEYIYISDTTSYRILSAGADGRLSPDTQKPGVRQGDFGDDLIFEDGEFVQPNGSEVAPARVEIQRVPDS